MALQPHRQNKKRGLENPRSLLRLSMESLLREEDRVIAALEHFPQELFPQLFLEAYAQKCREIVKAMVRYWPFQCLPVGCLIENLNLPKTFRGLRDVLDGIDILLSRKFHSRRCKLEVLDLRYTAQKFWTQWCNREETDQSTSRVKIDESSRKMHPAAPLEVILDLLLINGDTDQLSSIIVKWASGRKKIHLCIRKMYFVDSPFHNHDMDFIQPGCIQEVEATFVNRKLSFETFSPLGQMKRLQRLCLIVMGLEHICPGNQAREQLVTELSSQLLKLHDLQELYVDSFFFFRGHLDKVLGSLTPQLKALTILHCPLLERDLTHLCQFRSLPQLRELSLRGTDLSVVGESLPNMLESCASTLQDLDLGICRLQDVHLEAILPVLKLCSQLKILNLHWNDVSMAFLVQMLRDLAGLPHLVMELYPPPQESYRPNGGGLRYAALEVVCEELLEVLRDLGQPRSIMIGCDLCSYCSTIIFNSGQPMLSPACCRSVQIRKISHWNSEDKGVTILGF
ncbi:PRAME family member 12-like [Sorex fumeus]|uniref:PRAME family member 12-like n=1 Tax=Sorex fumeus TaxID=62283 RepID=UPI0024AD4058|nr:PRAME family member 12-like [Sorex fumeus]